MKNPRFAFYLQFLAAKLRTRRVEASLDDGGEAPFRTGFRISEKILVKESDPTARLVSATLSSNAMEALIERLEPGKTYYVRAFAENSAGVTHGAFKRIRIAESYTAPFAGKAEGQGWFVPIGSVLSTRQRKLGLSSGLRVDLPRTNQSKWYLVLERANRMVMDPERRLALPLDEQSIELDLLFWKERRTTHFLGLLQSIPDALGQSHFPGWAED